MEHAIVIGKRAAVAVEITQRRGGDEPAVLEGIRDSLAHQRIDPGRIAGQHRVPGGEPLAAIEPSNRKRSEAPWLARNFDLRESVAQLLDHQASRRASVGELIVDTNVEVGSSVDEARERPSVAAHSRRHAIEIEAVAMIAKLGARLRIHRNVDHQAVPELPAALVEERAPHPAARTIRADQQRRFEYPARPDDPHAAPALLYFVYFVDAAILDDSETSPTRGGRKRGIELIAPDDRAEHLSAWNVDRTDLGARAARRHTHGRDIDVDAEFIERRDGFRNQAAGADLGPRMMRLFERDHSASERGSAIEQEQRAGKTGGSGPGDDHVTSLREPGHRSGFSV